MSDAMKDVFGDFPGRPNTPDFWRLSEVVLSLDGASKEDDRTFEEITSPLVDVPSLQYIANQRVGLFLDALGRDVPLDVRVMLETVFLTSVVTGIEFQKRGGHRDGP